MKAAWLPLALVLAAVPAGAQPLVPPCNPKPTTYQDFWCAQIQEILDARGGTTGPASGSRVRIEEATQINGPNWKAFLLYAQAHSEDVGLAFIEDARIDKQVGAPAAQGGSTSAVSKGSVPGILAFAVENGALTQTTSATTVTLRGNLVGWADLLQNQGFIASYEDDSTFVRALRRVSYSLTLNTDTGASTAPSSGSGPPITPDAIRNELNKTKQQLVGYSVRVAIYDQRDPRAAANRASISRLLDTKGVEVLLSDDAFDGFFASDEYKRKWADETTDLLADPSRRLSATDIQKILYQRLEVARLLMISRVDNFNDKVGKALFALQAFDKARVGIFQAMQKRPLGAFEYVNGRDKNLPDKSTFRAIAEGQFGPKLDLTANVAFTIQNSGSVSLPEPRDVGGLRDFQAAVQLEVPFGSIEKRVSSGFGIGSPILGFAYLSQKLTERAAVSFAGNSFTVEPGWIHLVQAKVSVPVKGSGLKMPLSISWANRTELLKEKEIRGNIGVTFDMDVLSSLIRR